MTSTARWSLRLVLVALGAALVWWLVSVLWVIVLPVLLAMLITTVLWPPAGWLLRHGWPPAIAATAVVLGGLVVLGGVITLVVVSISDRSGEIVTGATSGLAQVQQWLSGPPLNLGQGRLDAVLSGTTERLQQNLSSISASVLTGVSTVTSGIVTAVLALVLAFLFVKDGRRFLPWLRRVAGPTAGRHLAEVSARTWRTLAGFVHTQALVALIDALFIGIGLVVVGVPLALPLAVITFFGAFVPIVGAFVAGAIAVLVALVSNGFTDALIVLGIIVAVQQIEGNLLEPLLQSHSLRLHAAVVLLAVTAGGSLFGIAGAFLSVPVVATGAVVLRYLSEQMDAQTAGTGSSVAHARSSRPVGSATRSASAC